LGRERFGRPVGPREELELKKAAAAALMAGLCVLIAAGCGGGGSSSGGGSGGDGSVSPADIDTYAGIQNETAQVYQEMLAGVNGVTTSAGSPKATPVVDEYDPQKELQLFSTVFSTGCDHCVIYSLDISPANAKPLVTQATRANAYISLSYLNTPGYNPWENGSNFVSFTAFDGKKAGYETGKALLESMGGKGNVIEIDGTPGPGPGGGDEKAAGFKEALEEFPDVKVLDAQAGEWEQEKGQEIAETLLSKYGDEIEGVWCANDAMALGVVQALKAKGLAGKVGVTGMDGTDETFELVKSGEMTATEFDSGRLIAAVATGLAHAASVGDIEPEELEHGQRKFFVKQTLVDSKNVDGFLGQESNPEYNVSELTYPALKKDFWKFSEGPMTPEQ
jgi:ribose transport system substrate-binding protein